MRKPKKVPALFQPKRLTCSLNPTRNSEFATKIMTRKY